MSSEQILVFSIGVATLALFLWGRWRHDMVALAALLASVFSGLVPARDAFAGFAHPAVISVACVLVLSQGLLASGAVDALTRRLLPVKSGPTGSIAALTALAAVLSAVMNNVGALALLMPVALQIAKRLELPPGRVLMPLAFGSILGGTTTLVGTPPNLIVSGFRAEHGVSAFGMFDFTPVGLAVTSVGLAFVGLLGWRLVPARERAGAEGFETGAYLTEARVPEGSKAAGLRLREVEAALSEANAQVVGLVRGEVRVTAPHAGRQVRAGDILVIEAEVDALPHALSSLGLELEEAKSGGDEAAEESEAEPREEEPASDEIVLLELAVLPRSELVGRSASDLLLRTRHGINLLAVSRRGQRSTARLRTLRLAAGDVLLVQGPPEVLAEFANQSGCVPLAERPLRIPDRRRALVATAIMGLALGSVALDLLPAAVAFATGVLASMVLRSVPPRAVYEAIDWPVIVMLAALLPVAAAMESTGAADLVARLLVEQVSQDHAVAVLAVILVITMTLSDLMNNAATAAVMCPIALGTAAQLEVSADPFLMAVALGASCAFLTPIGHQNNTLILGPGGFRFGDYWRMGLPLEVLVLGMGIPALLWAWPL